VSGLGESSPHSARAIWRSALPVWLGLMALLLLTLVLAYAPLGAFNSVAAVAIAFLKALLVVLFFMHLKRPDPLLRMTGAATLLWLFFLFTLTMADILDRKPPTQPGTLTPGTHQSAAIAR
jgi:cytochrome c oxidase subunit 4